VSNARQIPVDELFRQYVEAVEMVAADAVTQLAWMDSFRMPSDEILLQLNDAVYSFQPRLISAGLVTEPGVSAVAAIVAEFDSWTDLDLWRSDNALLERGEWDHVRETARRALTELNKPAS
jgi:hypothetical protein